jgi:trigger factor
VDTVVKSPESCKKTIEVEIPVDDVNRKFEEKVKKYGKEVRLPGFRAGKIPAKIIKSRFGDSIRAEVIESLINETYTKACADNKINPVSQPVIEDLKTEDESAPVSYKAVVEVDPEIDITDYKDLGISPEEEATTEEDINSALENIKSQFAEFSDRDRPAQEGDFVTVKYSEFTLDGEKSDESPAPQFIEVGKSPLKELDDTLKGMSQDEEAQISLTFPTDFAREDMAGKNAEFTVIVEKVQERRLPDTDDKKILEMAQVNTEDELIERIRKDIEKQKESTAKNTAYDKAIDAILAREGNDFDVPSSRVDAYIQHVMKQEERYYPQGNQPSAEEYRSRFEDTAKKTLKRFRILDHIAKKEKIKATKEEVDARIQELADQYNQDFDVIKDTLRQNGTTIQLREDIKHEKVLDTLIGKNEWPKND